MTAGAPVRDVRWMAAGHAYFLSLLDSVTDEDLQGPSRLPGWSGRHLLSHLGHNAKALERLATWAATGEPTPMYPNQDARAAEIETGAAWPVPRLRAFVVAEQERLTSTLDQLTGAMWDAEVVTAQGRTVPASTIPWLRSRELWVHACDLPYGGDFSALPEDFVEALVQDALARHRTAHDLHLDVVEGPAADLARWLTGRGASTQLRTTSGAPLPDLPPWL